MMMRMVLIITVSIDTLCSRSHIVTMSSHRLDKHAMINLMRGGSSLHHTSAGGDGVRVATCVDIVVIVGVGTLSSHPLLLLSVDLLLALLLSCVHTYVGHARGIFVLGGGGGIDRLTVSVSSRSIVDVVGAVGSGSSSGSASIVATACFIRAGLGSFHLLTMRVRLRGRGGGPDGCR